jgi:predicted Fe-Mo cluster-binding NifX family protein
MRVAIPLTNGLPAAHFGRCEQDAFIDGDTTKKGILDSVQEVAPEHELGLLPRWPLGRGVLLVVAGGMGSPARSLFEQAGVEVLTGAESGEPEEIAGNHLNGVLVTGAHPCDHRAAKRQQMTSQRARTP